MNYFKILGIAPNEAIQKHFIELNKKYPEIQIDIYISNSVQSLELVKNIDQSNYDMILARGETASMVRKIASIPVIEILFSQDSILHAIKLAETFHEKYAIVSFNAVTRVAYQLRELLSLNLDIFTIHNYEEASNTIASLKKRGYSIIISGLCIDYLINQYGLKHISISSSFYDIENVLHFILPFVPFYLEQKNRNFFYQDILDHTSNDILVIHNNEIIFSSLKNCSLNVATSLAFKAIMSCSETDFYDEKLLKNTLYSVNCKIQKRDGQIYYVITIYTKPFKFSVSKNELLYYSASEVSEIYLKHFNEFFYPSHEFSVPLANIISSKQPVIIYGEDGTGKEQLAAYIYTKSELSPYPYIVIDFDRFCDKAWSFLIGSTNSPLYSSKRTLYFRGLNTLSSSQLEQLVTVLRDSNLCCRNRILFSYSHTSANELPGNIFRLQDTLNCIPLYIKPLRDRKEAIPTLCQLYITTLNIEYSKQLIGLTPNALARLEEFPWKNNLIQFKRVLSQLVEHSYGSYISEEAVQRVLGNEEPVSSANTIPFDLSRSLHEITVDIVNSVVKSCDGNQTKAAKQLGICRTTLWKMMNEPPKQ